MEINAFSSLNYHFISFLVQVSHQVMYLGLMDYGCPLPYECFMFFYPSLPRTTHENATHAPFLSFRPSRSASQVTLSHPHEEQPLSEPVGIYSVMNAAGPVFPSNSHLPARNSHLCKSHTAPHGGSVLRIQIGKGNRPKATEKKRKRPHQQFAPLPWLEAGPCIRPFYMRRSGMKIRIWPCRSLRRMRLRALRLGYRLRGRRQGSISTGVIRRRSQGRLRVYMPLPLPQLQFQPQPANRDDGKRYELSKKITEEEQRKRSSEGEVEDELASFEEVKTQKELLKEGKLEVVENQRFIMEARRKGLEWGKERQRLREESIPTPVKEKRKFSLFPHPRRRRNGSEAHAAAAIQQLVVKQEREREVVTGVSAVPTPEGSSPSSQATGPPPKWSRSLSNGQFLGSLKEFFGPHQPSTPHGPPTRQRSTEATTNANTTIIIITVCTTTINKWLSISLIQLRGL